MKKEILSERYRAIAEEYINLFAKKQGLTFEYFVSDESDIACFGDTWFFNLSDIRLDIDSEIPKGEIIKWHDDNMDAGMDKMINYFSYTKGLRTDQISPSPPSNQTINK